MRSLKPSDSTFVRAISICSFWTLAFHSFGMSGAFLFVDLPARGNFTASMEAAVGDSGRIEDYFLELTGRTPRTPTVADIAPTPDEMQMLRDENHQSPGNSKPIQTIRPEMLFRMKSHTEKSRRRNRV